MLTCSKLKKIKPSDNYTGYDGSHHWGVLHKEVETIKCDFCRQKGIKLMRGMHDAVNVHIGKKIQYPKELKYTHNYVTRAIQHV
tara:strand:+ start:2053 stop:2304 length:252 start_codon:yes stop_codon:yes gene_type:complete